MSVLPSEIGVLKYIAATTGAPNLTIGAVTSITPPSFSQDAIETTVMGAGPMTYRASKIYDWGECQINIYYDPAVTSHDALTDAMLAGSEFRYGVCFDGSTVAQTFNAIITAFEPGELTFGANVTATITFKVTGLNTIA